MGQLGLGYMNPEIGQGLEGALNFGGVIVQVVNRAGGAAPRGQ